MNLYVPRLVTNVFLYVSRGPFLPSDNPERKSNVVNHVARRQSVQTYFYTWKRYESLNYIGSPLRANRLHQMVFYHLNLFIYHIEICVRLTPSSLSKGMMPTVSMRCFTAVTRSKSPSPCENKTAYPSSWLINILRVSNGSDGSTPSNSSCTYSESPPSVPASQPL